MTRRAVLIALLLPACGRIGFDAAPGDGGTDAPGAVAVDAAPGDVSTDAEVGDATPDGALASACAEAIPVLVDTPVSGNNCDGADRIEGCGPSETPELLFHFTAPSNGSYTFSAENDSGVIFSSGQMNATCSGVSSCSGILGTTMEAGEEMYFAIEDPDGGCVDFTFLVES